MTRGTKVPYGGKQTVGKGSAEDPFSSQSRKKRIDQVLTKYGVRGAGTSAGWQRGTGTKLEKPSPAKLQRRDTGLPTVSDTPAATQAPAQETGWKRAGKTSSSAVAEHQPEQIEADRQTAGQLGGKLRLGEATDRDVEDYLKRIQTDYGYTPATASQEEKLDQVQSYLRSQQPKAATYAELQAEGRDPLSRLANTVSGAAKQFGGSMAQTASTMAEQISPSMVLHLLNSPTAENPFLDRAADALLEPAKEWLVEGTQNTADRLSESGAKDIMKAQEGLNPAGRMLVNAGAGAAQMAGDAAIGAVTGGGSMLSLLARSFGGGVQEARGKGYSEEEQLALGLASAATEYFSERLFGGNPVYDKDVGLVNWLVGKVVKNPTVMKVLASAPVETVNEGLEEMVSGLLNPALEWAITGNRPEYELDELIEEGATGILAALLARGGAAVVNRAVKSSLVNDATADDLLRDRKAMDFLSRKGGLELKNSMSQAEKRQAVREAVEKIAGQGKELIPDTGAEKATMDAGVEEGEIGDAFRRTLKSFAARGRVVSFEKLPQEFQTGFVTGLDTSAPEIKALLSEAYNKADYVVGKTDRSYYRHGVGQNTIYLGHNATPSTLAHELFHQMDKGHRISSGLSSALTQDYVALQVVSGGDIKGYLMERYPEAFYTTKLGKIVMYEQYRGIADILNGLSEGADSYGFRHSKEYWKMRGAVEAEAWAQFGRIMYDNDPQVREMFAALFPNLLRDAIIAAEGRI